MPLPDDFEDVATFGSNCLFWGAWKKVCTRRDCRSFAKDLALTWTYGRHSGMPLLPCVSWKGKKGGGGGLRYPMAIDLR